MDFVHPVQAIIPGVQGRVLAVLAEASSALNLSTLARLADVSVAQASRVMPGLVDLGLVERSEVPPSSQFRLVHEHVAAQPIIDLARCRDAVVQRMGEAAAAIAPRPVSVILFGSFTRGEADVQSDVDVVVIRPDEVDEDDDEWANSVEKWRSESQALVGNRVEILEVTSDEGRNRLAADAPLWRNIAREGIVIHGLALEQLAERVDA